MYNKEEKWVNEECYAFIYLTTLTSIKGNLTVLKVKKVLTFGTRLEENGLRLCVNIKVIEFKDNGKFVVLNI